MKNLIPVQFNRLLFLNNSTLYGAYICLKSQNTTCLVKEVDEEVAIKGEEELLLYFRGCCSCTKGIVYFFLY